MNISLILLAMVFITTGVALEDNPFVGEAMEELTAIMDKDPEFIKGPEDVRKFVDSFNERKYKSVVKSAPKPVRGIIDCWVQEYGVASLNEPGIFEGKFKDGEKCYEEMKQAVTDNRN